MGATLTNYEVLNCSLNKKQQLKCVLSGPGELDCKMSYSYETTHPTYPGPYEATPSTSEQTFPTRDKVMNSNFAVNPIPYFEVSNEYGTTVNIGG